MGFRSYLNISLFCSTLIFTSIACQMSKEEIPEEQNESELAKIIDVSVSGNAGSYTLSVTIESPDTGCEQYANWWEVITPNGDLVYRRILGHSHVNEQPFTRSGGPINIDSTDSIIIRAHMNTTGYGNQIFQGSIADILNQSIIDSSFALELETKQPLPGPCPF